MIPDKLLINLKIISKIQKNGRITRSYDGIISLENDVFYQSIKRFISSDSRKQAVFEINSVITECIDSLHNILNSKYMNKNFSQSDEYSKNCESISLLLKEMDSARGGIENLKFTYQNDQNITSQIDIIILKINTHLKDVSHKLTYYQSFLETTAQSYPVTFYYNNIDNTQPNSYQSSNNLTSIRIDGEENIEQNVEQNVEYDE